MAVINYFCHINENLSIKIDILGIDKEPLDISTLEFEFATAIDQTSNTIQTLTSNNGINIVDANTGTIEINFNPDSNLGYQNKNLIYQLRMIDQANSKNIYQYGRIFIEPSLFQNSSE